MMLLMNLVAYTALLSLSVVIKCMIHCLSQDVSSKGQPPLLFSLSWLTSFLILATVDLPRSVLD